MLSLVAVDREVGGNPNFATFQSLLVKTSCGKGIGERCDSIRMGSNEPWFVEESCFEHFHI